MSTVFNFWVLNLGSIGSLLSQGDLVDTFLLPEELETDQGFESEPDFGEDPEQTLADPEGVAELEPETEESDASSDVSAGDDPDPEGWRPLQWCNSPGTPTPA